MPGALKSLQALGVDPPGAPIEGITYRQGDICAVAPLRRRQRAGRAPRRAARRAAGGRARRRRPDRDRHCGRRRAIARGRPGRRAARAVSRCRGRAALPAADSARPRPPQPPTAAVGSASALHGALRRRHGRGVVDGRRRGIRHAHRRPHHRRRRPHRSALWLRRPARRVPRPGRAAARLRTGVEHPRGGSASATLPLARGRPGAAGR